MSDTISKWLVFVDECPMANWSHACTYYYVSKDINHYVFPIADNFPPVVAELKLAHRCLTVQEQNGGIEIYALPDSVNGSSCNTVALVMGGGFVANYNYQRYWNDCSYLYRVLKRRYRMSDSNIHLLIGSGGTNNNDMVSVSGQYIKMSKDLDFNQLDENISACTKSNILAELNNIKILSQNNQIDELLIFFIGHGGYDYSAGESYICTWGNGKLYAHELDDAFEGINARSINLVLGQCFSGGFIEPLSANGRVVATACESDTFSFATPDLYFDEFVHQWTNAINSFAPDVDYDGNVSMKEAFEWASAHDLQTERPQYRSTTDYLGEVLSLNHVPEGVQLYIKDGNSDSGTQPSVENPWQSQSVFLKKNYSDGYTYASSDQTFPLTSEDPAAYVTARVTNRGWEMYHGSGKYVHIFWSMPGLSHAAESWDGSTSTGGHVSSLPINGNILPSGSLDVTVSWNVPQKLIELAEQNNGWLHVDLLAYVSNSALPYFPGYSSIEDVRQNRNLAQRSVVFMNNKEVMLPLEIRNPHTTDHYYSIELVPDQEQPSEMGVAQVDLVMSESLYGSWVAGGQQSYRMTTPNGDCHAKRALWTDSRLEHIKLEANQIDTLTLRFTIQSTNAPIDVTEHFNLIQRDAITGDIIGAQYVGFRICRNQHNINPGIGGGWDPDPEPGYGGEIGGHGNAPTLRLFATNVDMPSKFEWFNCYNESVGSGDTIYLASDPHGPITLKVTVDEDQSIAFATKQLSRMQYLGECHFLANNDMSVELLEEAESGQQIVITDALNGVELGRKILSGGERQAIVMVSPSATGMIIISLIHSGTVLDSKKISN